MILCTVLAISFFFPEYFSPNFQLKENYAIKTSIYFAVDLSLKEIP